MEKFVIGIDYGTESGRVLLVNVENGEELAVQVTEYPHGVITSILPGTNLGLPRDWALQDPTDYITVLTDGIPAVLQKSGIHSHQVIGVGIDFTSCTMLPIDGQGTPLCLKPEFRNISHSWVKLWKHHAAESEASVVTEIAALRGEAFLKRYGGKVSPEWMVPKILQIVREAPEVYECADRFVEAADWLVMQLTGKFVRNRAGAGYKGMWHEGFPQTDYFKALHPTLESISTTKLRGDVITMGQRVGGLSPDMADKTGLLPGTAVAAGMIDAHSSVPGAGVYEPGKMVMVMGTSTCHMLMHTEEKFVEGIAGVVKDGIIPGYYGYEAGQAAVGDLFGWFTKSILSSSPGSWDGDITQCHDWLEKEASQYRPGETGLLALDWWNGNRSILMDAGLTGMLIGCTLSTTPPEIYRALLEATAYGTRIIIETLEQNGVPVNELYATGGLPKRNRLLMQIYADVTKRQIKVPASEQTGALGAAICGAVAAMRANGGYDTIGEAIRHMARHQYEVYRPVDANTVIYDELFEMYKSLHDYFGRHAHSLMKELKSYSRSV